MPRTAVLALGGNAFTRADQNGSYDEQEGNALEMARTLVAVRAAGWNVVVVHGNGPQVGNLSIQQEEGRALVPAQPLFSLGAMTQGELGSLICLAINRVAPDLPTCALVTHVVVDAADPAFERPTKPIGPFFTAERAASLAASRGWTVAEDAGRGFRRVVASPRPVEIHEARAVRQLADAGTVVVAGGGGGVPVVRTSGTLSGIDAVIDKDYVAARLAHELSAAALVLVTGVPEVRLDFGTDRDRPLHHADVRQMDEYLSQGQFPPGSMAPKVRAASEFLTSGGELAVITDPENVLAALEGGHGVGTRILPSTSTVGPQTGEQVAR